MSRRPNTVWFEDFRGRLRFEVRARSVCRDMTVRKEGRGLGASIVYRFEVDVPYYDSRRVEVRFRNGFSPEWPRVTVDGPEESPHRYRGGTLCIWEPTDPDERVWVPRDGLHELIRQITFHLFKEAWWRESGEWLGDEVRHDLTVGKAE
jgi:hypothetical protein